jgi:hypothetical protein
VRVEVAPQCRGRVDVVITNPHREVECTAPFVDADRSDHISPAYRLTCGQQPFTKIGVRRSHPAVVDRHGVVSHHNAAERDLSVSRRVNLRPCGSGDIDPPVAAVAARREKPANDLAGYRRGKPAAPERGQQSC